jgi:predicted dehydrogenase/threonine dehydrogenase-like Zn-dependent dehydrogenase
MPSLPAGFVLVQTHASLVSAGTERMITQFSQKNLAQKAMARPDLVRQVLDRIKRDGLLTTIETVRGRLDEPMALGYSVAGTVLEAGRGAEEFQPGQRVACAGAGMANHAEIVCVPRNLCVVLPPGVDFDEAVFATVGAIAMHGVRLANVQFGSRVAVIGLGLLGQLTVQMLNAAGCLVIGVDLMDDRVDLARQFGAEIAITPESAISAASDFSSGVGVDAVLITADAPGNETVELAGAIARDRAMVVAVGAVGMNIPRRSYFAKELQFVVSRSYGPGRYDASYEIKGRDYPIGYVRWTERRNMASFLDLVARASVRVKPLITHRFPIESAASAYDVITGKTEERFLGVVLTYPTEVSRQRVVPVAAPAPARPVPEAVRIGVLGAGDFARGTLLPSLKQIPEARLVAIASQQGLSAKTAANRFGFAYCTTEEQRIQNDPDINAVFIITRHNLHARQALAACAAGKHVFVEKPLCLTEDELRILEEAFQAPGAPLLMVGFNRRFAPLAISLRHVFQGITEPLVADYRINAGFIPPDHWVHDPLIGGGRVIGEVCHFIDFLGWLMGGTPETVSARGLPDTGKYRGDNIVITLTYPNGAVGTITYIASGDRGIGKERIEVHGGGRSAVLSDFRRLELYRNGRRSVKQLRLRQDKGHRTECREFVEALLTGGPSPIALTDIIGTTRATILAVKSAGSGQTFAVTP